MALHDIFETDDSAIPQGLRRFIKRRSREVLGLSIVAASCAASLTLMSWSAQDLAVPSATHTTAANWLGFPGAVTANLLLSSFGLGALPLVFIPLAWALKLLNQDELVFLRSKLAYWVAAVCLACGFFSCIPVPSSWLVSAGIGGQLGDVLSGGFVSLLAIGLKSTIASAIVAATFLGGAAFCSFKAMDLSREIALSALQATWDGAQNMGRATIALLASLKFGSLKSSLKSAGSLPRKVTVQGDSALERDTLGSLAPGKTLVRGRSRIDVVEPEEVLDVEEDDLEEEVVAPARKIVPVAKVKKQQRQDVFDLPDLSLLAEPKKTARGADLSADQLEENARALEGVLDDFGVKGQIVAVKPGPVVTLYELEPAPGIKSSRVISLADDIARSMSAISARVAVVQGRNAIGIELPNAKRETVYLREMFQTENFANATGHLQVALGKNIGGEPIYADLARMPHLLIAGTTGSGKSVGINTLILSLLYRLSPQQCKLIMIDPKMLELSVYEGIPHLLAPVVTDPKKAVVALKWAVREMEERYKKMSKVGVRNVDGYNTRVTQLLAKGEKLTRTIQTGFDPETGEPCYEHEEMDTNPMPYIVVIIDEMADLMMVAGKDIEGAVQRLAQMARAAGIHVIMATQRPSVDVITGTIKANFPTRISFQVTSKIDSRTILGEMGAEQLLGQGDMLYMAGGGRISRLHGPFVSDGEVEAIVSHLKSQGSPDYVEAVTEEPDEEYGDGPLAGGEGGSSGDSLYDQAVAVVLRDKKVSTSYVQRRLQIGYNKAASLIERMEKEGLISGANATGKREILVPGDSARL
jgi:DNA segregation ATPase FtsK/SpoIIIE, S-DNA-T family